MNEAHAASDPRRIGALLSGRTVPRARIARALGAFLAPLTRAARPIEGLVDKTAIVPRGVGSAADATGGKWALLAPACASPPDEPVVPDGRQGSGTSEEDGEERAILVHLPERLAALAGTLMLAGPGDGGTIEAEASATPIDWSLAVLLVDALGRTMPEPMAFRRWCDAPDPETRIVGRLGLDLARSASRNTDSAKGEGGAKDRDEHPVLLAIPTAMLLEASGGAEQGSSGGTLAARQMARTIAGASPRGGMPTSGGGAAASFRLAPAPPHDARRQAPLGVIATLDLGACDLRDVVGLQPGDVLPIDGGLGSVALRVRGEGALFTGALGQSGSHLCVRLAERAPEQRFRSLSLGAAGTAPEGAGPRSDSAAQAHAPIGVAQ